MEVTAGRDHDSTGSGDSGRGASEEGEKRGRPRPGEAPIPARNSGRCIAGFIPKCSSIDLFRGACAVKGNVQVAGHVKRIDNGAAFNA